MTKRSEKVVTGVLSGVLKVSGFFTSSIANSTVGKKFFSLLPGEIVLASLDGFSTSFISISCLFCIFTCLHSLFCKEIAMRLSSCYQF